MNGSQSEQKSTPTSPPDPHFLEASTCRKPNDNIHLKILVPSVAAGAIIGKGGEAIALIQKETGAKIKLSKANDFYPGTTERVCLIQGTLEGVTKMHDYIVDRILEKPELLPVSPGALSVQGAGVIGEPAAGQQAAVSTTFPPGWTATLPLSATTGHCPVNRLLWERHKQVKILVPNCTAGLVIGKFGAYVTEIKDTTGAFIQISQKSKDINLSERCITIAGEPEQCRAAVSLVLAKIAEDPQSATCPNISYAHIQGPVASAYPTGSPFAFNPNTNADTSTGHHQHQTHQHHQQQHHHQQQQLVLLAAATAAAQGYYSTLHSSPTTSAEGLSFATGAGSPPGAEYCYASATGHQPHSPQQQQQYNLSLATRLLAQSAYPDPATGAYYQAAQGYSTPLNQADAATLCALYPASVEAQDAGAIYATGDSTYTARPGEPQLLTSPTASFATAWPQPAPPPQQQSQPQQQAAWYAQPTPMVMSPTLQASLRQGGYSDRAVGEIAQALATLSLHGCLNFASAGLDPQQMAIALAAATAAATYPTGPHTAYGPPLPPLLPHLQPHISYAMPPSESDGGLAQAVLSSNRPQSERIGDAAGRMHYGVPISQPTTSIDSRPETDSRESLQLSEQQPCSSGSDQKLVTSPCFSSPQRPSSLHESPKPTATAVQPEATTISSTPQKEVALEK